jgi:hypothetical protein
LRVSAALRREWAIRSRARGAGVTLSAMYGMPEEPAEGRDRSTAVTVIASIVAVAAAAGVYLHPDRVRGCVLGGSSRPALCELGAPVTLELLIGLAVFATAVALVATVFGLVGDWKCYRGSR